MIFAPSYTDNYTYDLNSNRIGETEDQGNTGSTTDTITSTYNADDELTQAVDANTGTTLYGYDSNGSQTSVTHTPNGATTPDTTTTNEYDLQGQLAGSQVTTSAGTAKTTYYYDDSGNRIEEVTVAAGSTTPVTTYYLVDTNNPTGYSQPIEQASTPGTPQITYIWGAQLISETYATGAAIPGVGTASSPTTYYLLQDAHGSTRLVTDATGNIVARYSYDGYGNALGFSAATALTTYLYGSMPFDAASGNYYDHARFYDSGTGSFTQSDYGYSGSLTNPMTDLSYMFTGGDPINMLDLNGHAFSLPDVMAAMVDMANLAAIRIAPYAGVIQLAITVATIEQAISNPGFAQQFVATGGEPGALAEAFANDAVGVVRGLSADRAVLVAFLRNGEFLAGEGAQVIRNALDNSEFVQAKAAAELRGGTFIGQLVRYTRGIDGFIELGGERIPVSLTGYGGDSPAGVLSTALDKRNSLARAHYRDAELFITAKGVNAQDLINFAEGGNQPLLNLPRTTLRAIYVDTAQGWVAFMRLANQ